MTVYSDKDLRREAVLAVRAEARAAKVRARCTGFRIHLQPRGDDGMIVPTLVACGERTDLPYRQHFTVNVAI